MIKYSGEPVKLANGALVAASPAEVASGREHTMAYKIMRAHDIGKASERFRIRFDGMLSHDITYVGIVQTARASGMKRFPLPYALTNCHNSLCAVGGTINEDDHIFGLSAAKKYGGDFIPAHLAVIHQYARECMAGCGKMLLGSDSHTRYGALGTMGVGEGGPELVKQLCNQTYDIACPPVVAVWLTGAPRPGVGPHDVALALVQATFGSGAVKNKVLEFIGPGVDGLSVEYRSGIDVMTTETTCLSSIWRTDDKTRDYLARHGRPDDYSPIAPDDGAVYDACVTIELDKVRPMIALPFHPSRAFAIADFRANAADILAQVQADAQKLARPGAKLDLLSKLRGGELYVDQGVIAGCAGGTFENVTLSSRIVEGKDLGAGEFALNVYPASQPQYLALVKEGAIARLMQAGAVLRSAICGPCFGAGDVPGNNCLSIRHTTRNFPSREGAKPGDGQMAYVALMDARSIAATAINQGRLTAADEIELPNVPASEYIYDPNVYAKRVYHGIGHPDASAELVFGPNIADWPEQPALPENLVIGVASAIYDPVTTTDELIPSGETSSYRSNPLKLASFALGRKDPRYVPHAREWQALERTRHDAANGGAASSELNALLSKVGLTPNKCGIGSAVFALKPGDGSAREQAASCQRVLGGCANIAGEYATKRYRSNVVNWGMLPFILSDASDSGIATGDVLVIRGIRSGLLAGKRAFEAELFTANATSSITLSLPDLGAEELEILLDGCLINYYARTLKD